MEELPVPMLFVGLLSMLLGGLSVTAALDVVSTGRRRVKLLRFFTNLE